jgi:hypothetical protein
MIKCYELFTIFYAPACRHLACKFYHQGLFLNLGTNTVHKITGYKLCKIIFHLSSTSMPWKSTIHLYMSIKPEKYKYTFYTQLKLGNGPWEWFEIWYAASTWWVVSWVWLSSRLHINFLLGGGIHVLWTHFF